MRLLPAGGAAAIVWLLVAPATAHADQAFGGTDELSLGVEPFPIAATFSRISFADHDRPYSFRPAVRAEWRHRFGSTFSLRLTETVNVRSLLDTDDNLLLVLATTTLLAEAAAGSGNLEVGVAAGGGFSLHVAHVDEREAGCRDTCARPGLNVFLATRVTFWTSPCGGLDLTTRTGFAASEWFIELHGFDLGISWRRVF